MKEIMSIMPNFILYEAPNWTNKEITISKEIGKKCMKYLAQKKSVSEKASLVIEELKNMPLGALVFMDDTLFYKKIDRWGKYESKIKI